MGNINKILKMSSAFIGIIVGAGFASGKEVLQYYTSFGTWGTIGAIVSTILFAYLGMSLMRVGSVLQVSSHKEAIDQISGRFLSKMIDAVIVLTLFGVGTVMIAGAGANLEQQFEFSPIVGSVLLVLFVFLTILMNVDKVIAVIASFTPLLVLAIILVALYSFFTMDTSFAVLDPIAQSVPTTLPNWFVAMINHVSFNIAVGASMAFVVGGAEKNSRIASFGGLFGGGVLGILIALSHLAIFSKVDLVADENMPMLALIYEVSPFLGLVMGILLYGMIFSTAVSMFYALGARFTLIGTKAFKKFVILSLLIGFGISFFGFSKLIDYLYPFIGYVGLLLVIALIFAPFHIRRSQRS